MKLLIPILVGAIISPCFPNAIRQQKSIGERRQMVGYSNSILHENPNYPDQSALSSVKVSFNPHNSEQNPIYQQPYAHASASSPQSQLFNVGYSVSFTNNQQPKQPPKQRSTLDNAEIITGSRKQNEPVQAPPNQGFSPQDYVSIALLDSKRHKVSGINPKPQPQPAVHYPNPKTILREANLAPVTQKYLSVLEHLKPQVPNTQDLQQRYSWRNLGPGVEIIRSTEVPTVSQKSSPFDHAKALGRSQDFDYTNAVDNGIVQQPSTYYVYKQKPLPNTNLPPITRVLPSQQVEPKFTIDTSLLQENVPIQMDSRLLEAAMRNQQVQQFYGNVPYVQQPQPQQSQHTQESYLQHRSQPVQVFFSQDTQGAQSYQDYQPEQSRFQYKIYGKPQPLSSETTGQSQIQVEHTQRQPRFLGDLHTSLRPPPFTTGINYQRRMMIMG